MTGSIGGLNFEVSNAGKDGFACIISDNGKYFDSYLGWWATEKEVMNACEQYILDRVQPFLKSCKKKKKPKKFKVDDMVILKAYQTHNGDIVISDQYADGTITYCIKYFGFKHWTIIEKNSVSSIIEKVGFKNE